VEGEDELSERVTSFRSETSQCDWQCNVTHNIIINNCYLDSTEQLFKKGMMIIEYWQTIGNTEVWCRGHTLNQSPADSTHGAPHYGGLNILHNPILSNIIT
jgi:hypothetical protein